MPQRYSRKISPVERLALTVNEFYHYNVTGIIEGKGTVDPKAMQAAADKAAAANPGVRVRLRGWLGFGRWVDSGIAPQVRLLPLTDWDGRSEAGAPFLAERFEPLRGGPIADILIVPCRDGLTRLVFRTLHAAMDGRGALYWGADVARALRGEPLIGSDSTLTDVEVQAQYADKVPAEPQPEPGSAIPALPAGPSDGAPLRYVWRRLTIERNIGFLLPKTAAFLAEYARRRETGEVAFTIPIDYRGLRTKESSVGNLTGYARLVVPEGADARSLMTDVQDLIRSYADCRPVPKAGPLLWLPISTLRRRIGQQLETFLFEPNPVNPTGGLVSMGTVFLQPFEFPGFQPRGIHGIPGAVGKLNVVFVNSNDCVSICFTAPARYNDHGQFDEMVMAYQRYFASARQST